MPLLSDIPGPGREPLEIATAMDDCENFDAIVTQRVDDAIVLSKYELANVL